MIILTAKNSVIILLNRKIHFMYSFVKHQIEIYLDQSSKGLSINLILYYVINTIEI